ncbi:mismatch-specific DNA-glycosylase [Azospirillum doebereinerae]|uniref:Mismatch-specific DNA-glycosylase n=1 Tax=Azospirillum doebereinerae TaxID=92933 RepID=A0A433J183_9PROT|nr:mismatch-specific DNA-glycosylase [Azospirillum doebereinerae]RUQ63939.1 mismatch-specific DNA-glycosylase [Azospirillum doebereinerae]
MTRDLFFALDPDPADPTLPDPEGPLPDIVAPGLDCLFVGFNPGLRSGALGHHYAGRGNQFWRLLAAAGLTPRPMRPEEDRSLPDVGLGSTNLVARATASAAELSRAELRGGLPRLARIVAVVRPAVLAYTGKGVYLAAAGCADAPWGVQARPLFEGVSDVVVPSPSGLARLPFEEKLRWYKAVKAEIARLRPCPLRP